MFPAWRELRRTLRAILQIPPNQPAVCFGEQSVGLWEPSVVLGKRVVAACLEEEIVAYDYQAQTDVPGSEPGLNSVSLPNPFHDGGIERVSTLPERVNDIPTSNIPIKQFKKSDLLAALDKIYSKKNPRSQQLKELIEKSLQQNLSIADFNDQLFTYFCEEIGLPRFPEVIDYEFDTFSFLNGGMELILLEYWDKIIESACKTQANLGKTYCRVPEKNEAPFFIIVTNIPYPRARILWDRERSVFWGVAPQNPQKIVIPEISFSELLSNVSEGKIKIAWRAIPRAIILATVFDGHISGGGALYNKVVAPVFEELTGVAHYPIAFLSPINEEGEGVLQYRSAACRKTDPPYLIEAQNAVKANRVSLLDFYLSIKPKEARSVLTDFINSNRGCLPLSSRIEFPANVFIHS
ncbi:MAG: hypothetical protein QXV64_03045 [Candidatus Anstonellaceae archaeon]